MISICLIAQTAIFLKRKFEHRRDNFAVGNITYEEKKDDNNCMNNLEWNPYICTTPRTFFFLVAVFILHLCSGNLLFKWSNLNSHEKSLLATNAFQVILSLGVPLYMYSKNMSIFQHLIHEILEEFFGIENILTNFPKFPSMICPSAQKMKMLLQKLQSKSEPLEISTNTSPHTDSTSMTIKMTNEIVLNQVQEENFDKVNEEPNPNYPKSLSYRDQKALLSAARLKDAGFQLSNDTPEDGNCLIHALKDQMR